VAKSRVTEEFGMIPPGRSAAKLSGVFPENAAGALCRVQSKVEEKPCQAKHKCKTYALTFKFVKSEGRRPVAIQAIFRPVRIFRVIEASPGLPRRYAPRF
jgi:hypothetical protein